MQSWAKIKQQLMAAAAAAVPEVAQMFVYGQALESHAQVDPDQFGKLFGFVALNRRLHPPYRPRPSAPKPQLPIIHGRPNCARAQDNNGDSDPHLLDPSLPSLFTGGEQREISNKVQAEVTLNPPRLPH